MRKAAMKRIRKREFKRIADFIAEDENALPAIEKIARFMAEDDIGLGGEFLTYMELRELTAPRRLLSNLLVPTATGKRRDTEIDLVLIHGSGLYVLEVKEYSGWIFGNPKERHWTQTLKNKRGDVLKYPLYNPLRQNYSHVQALKQIFASLGDIPIYPIVVFSDHCEFRTQLTTQKEPVIHRHALQGTVKRIAQENSNRLSAGDIETIYRRLLPFAYPSIWRRRRHRRYVQSKKT